MSLQGFSDNLSTLSYIPKRRLPLWFYNPKKKTCLGRTPFNWFLLLLFYAIYYTCLAAFFCCLLWTFLYFGVPENEPARTGANSLLGFKAGLGFRPLLKVHMSLIKYARSDPQDYLMYTENIEAFLDYYKVINSKPDSQFGDCRSSDRDIEKSCKYPLTKLGVCNSENLYGYPEGKPCVIIKLNKIYGWLPDIENTTFSKNALFNCVGQNPADDQNIGKVVYSPGVNIGGQSYGVFDSAYFPYISQPGYLSPIVAVQFVSPAKHTAILVKCEVFNVKNSYKDKFQFELLVD